MPSEQLWTGFHNRKIGAERAIKDAKGRNLADSIDKIPSTYVSGAALSNNNKTLTLTVTDQSASPATTTTVAITDTGDANVQSDWAETDETSDSYIANKPAIIIPLASASYAAPTNVTVVSTLPSTRNPTTIYLVPETLT
ncbi:MAG: hypothetical protein IKA48_02505 [Fibrobacter sp.]|nr:hypothetical protein [Fibrobacter sp.]